MYTGRATAPVVLAWQESSSGINAGVTGQGPSNGVYGNSTGTDPNTSIGVVGLGAAAGVYGRSPGTVSGSAGVQGVSAAAPGVYGISTNTAGVLGSSTNGNGVSGSSSASFPAAGVLGQGANAIGVYGVSINSYGMYGYSTKGIGVLGVSGGGSGASSPFGVVGAVNAAPGFGLYGVAGVAGAVGFAAGAVSGAIAGQFSGAVNVYNGFLTINGTGAPAGTVGLVVTGGATKNAAVPVADGSYRLLHCVEAPEPWFEDFGTGTLTGGKAEVKLDPDFLAATDTKELHVFFTPHDEQHTLHLAGKRRRRVHRRSCAIYRRRGSGTHGGKPERHVHLARGRQAQGREW